MEDVVQRVEDRLRAVGLSPRAASLKAKLSGDAIRNMQRAVGTPGRKGTTVRTLTALAPVLETSAHWLMTGEGDPGDATDSVPVVGYVSAGDVAILYDVGQGNLDMVPRPQNATQDTVAAEIKGTSLGPSLDGWLVYYDDVRSPITPDLYGELCVAGLPDGRVVVKRLVHTPSGAFHLLSNGIDPPMLDQEVLWAAKVKGITPR